MKLAALVGLISVVGLASCGHEKERCRPTDLWVTKRVVTAAFKSAYVREVPYRLWSCPDGDEWRDW